MFAPGTRIVAREVHDGLLWAARPAYVVEDDGSTLVHWSPAGTLGCSATSRFMAERDHLPRDERQLISLETRRWQYRGVPQRGTKLTFVRFGSYASVSPTWDAGHFVHWYVNFQLPAVRYTAGYDTLDLVLDLVVAPDWSWTWKDRASFDEALRREIFDQSIARGVENEAEEVLAALDERSGPFAAAWKSWSPPLLPVGPELPADFAAGLRVPTGSTLSLDERPASGLRGP